jgi:hypothetical protein
MGRQHIGHDEIATFAQDKVNLPKDAADEYRAQARRLREKLEGYLSEHPDFTLKKMLLSGSLAKGTAHLEFAAKRKRAQEKHFAQVVRLVKFWARRMKQERDGFRFKSFMIEMILAKLCDDGLDFSDYPEALQHFFTYVARTDFRQQIVFSDYYPASSVGTFPDTVQIIDPVNATNNVARLYTTTNADAIVDAALDAGDAIDAALAAPNKQLTVAYWQKVFGSSFQA